MKPEKKDKYIEVSNKGISEQLISELYKPSIDLSIDYTEIFIDEIINNDAIKEIPLIKTVIGVIKGGVSINQFWFAKKLLTFIKEFNNGEVSKENLNSFINKVNSDPKYGQKIAERLMIFIEKNIEITQTLITANLFKAFINEKITFVDFNNIMIALDKLHPSSYQFFFELEKNNFEIGQKIDVKTRNWEMESLITSSGFARETSDWWHGFKLKNEGRKLFEFGIKPLKG